MYRKKIEFLHQWQKRPSSQRKPLIIRGARQVGKSYLVRLLANEKFSHFVEVNFEKNRHMGRIFESNDPRKIISALEIETGKTIEAGKTLLFLDEVQAAPHVLTALRYFYEEMPELHLIAAGSLLDVTLSSETVSMPVGRVEYLHLYPMSFEEYLLATGHKKLHGFLQSFKWGDEIALSIHEKAMMLIKEYLNIGGMPEVVAAYATRSRLKEADQIKKNLLASYEDDFFKYSKKAKCLFL